MKGQETLSIAKLNSVCGFTWLGGGQTDRGATHTHCAAQFTGWRAASAFPKGGGHDAQAAQHTTQQLHTANQTHSHNGTVRPTAHNSSFQSPFLTQSSQLRIMAVSISVCFLNTRAALLEQGSPLALRYPLLPGQGVQLCSCLPLAVLIGPDT